MYQKYVRLSQLWNLRNSDASLSSLLAIQCLMTFVLVPLVATHVITPVFTDIGLLSFTVICAVVYAERIGTLMLLLGCMLAILFGPAIGRILLAHKEASGLTLHEAILTAAFLFNVLITSLVTQHTFGAGRVTRHRILGAVLVYLNVAVLFSILYDLLETRLGGSLRFASGALLSPDMGERHSEMTYFSMVTITTCGYGDIVPVHPFMRSLTTIEAFFGQLFPATFVARLVALHLSHNGSLPPDQGN